MRHTPTVTVTCDTPGCDAEVTLMVFAGDDLDEDLRLFFNWVTIGNSHFCEDCHLTKKESTNDDDK
jgi:hypothetical protein